MKQDAGLRPIDDSLDKLHNNYLTMGEALDNTRHYMPVQDIVIGNEGEFSGYYATNIKYCKYTLIELFFMLFFQIISPGSSCLMEY